MSISKRAEELITSSIIIGDHKKNDYFKLIIELVDTRNKEGEIWQKYIDQLYEMVLDEMVSNTGAPRNQVKFGTSGWRGELGKDINCSSVGCVTAAIIEMYLQVDDDPQLAPFLGVVSLEEAKERGCVIGFDNRFGGDVLAATAAEILANAGFKIHYAGESTTGALSAAVMELGAAFSVNLTPSHNPLQYGGYKFNAADAGPAAAELTSKITEKAREVVADRSATTVSLPLGRVEKPKGVRVNEFDALAIWKQLVRKNRNVHGIDYDNVIQRFSENEQCVVVIDSVHGASRLHVSGLFNDITTERIIHLRGSKDVTFGGVAPEPSSKNMRAVADTLRARQEKIKLGAIIDPDGDRIRFTDGTTEISMNQFGAMAYHFLHEVKGKKGMVAKTVATSNFANGLAHAFGEEVFEPKVGFKEFKPVIGKALVYFEESDGISIIGHTPEKDAYIGLIVALDMVLTTGKSLGDYKQELEQQYGSFYPDRDGITVSLQGSELLSALARLEKYGVGATVQVDGMSKKIIQVIDIDGRKMILEDGSWLMIRPSGTEPKVRFYVESKTSDGTVKLVQAAKSMLTEIGLL